MRLTLLLLLFIFSVNRASSQLNEFISRGLWNDPSNWSLGTVPDPTTDSIRIWVDVELTSNIVIGNYLDVYGACITDGGNGYSITLDSVSSSNATFIHPGNALEIEQLIIAHSSCFADISGDIIIRSNIYNDGNLEMKGHILVGETVYLESPDAILTILPVPVTGGGFLDCANMISSGTIDCRLNTSICIQDTLINSFAILGSGDICDSSPGGAGDSNSGTTSSTITYCQYINCQPVTISCDPLNSIHDSYLEDISVYPNPADDFLYFEFPADLSLGIISIYSITGKLISTTSFTGHYFSLDISGWANEFYILEMKTGDQIFRSKFIKE